MSERKSDEIKFRIEPSVKARWQEAADVDKRSESLSDFIRAAVDEKIQAEFRATVAAAGEALAAGDAATLVFLRGDGCSRDDAAFDGCRECGKSNAELGSRCGKALHAYVDTVRTDVAENGVDLELETLGVRPEADHLVVKRSWHPFGADLVG